MSSMKMKEEDKHVAVDSAKRCCNSFSVFVDKFAELIFSKLLHSIPVTQHSDFCCFLVVASMLTAGGFKIFWTVASPDSGDWLQKSANLCTCLHYVALSVILFFSMRGNEKTKYYFGFLDGQFSKAFFLLFCANLVYPINIQDVNGDGISGIIWLLRILSWFLCSVAILQLVRICTGSKEDSTNHAAMMEDDANISMKID